MKKLIITGPESSGKTTICRHLSSELRIPWLEEYSRSYLEQYGPSYNLDDLVAMAKKSAEIINQRIDERLILDTDIITYKIWSEFKYNATDLWISQNLNMNKSNVYLLCYPDIEWQEDPLRENPNDRKELFNKYENLLIELKLSYFIIAGSNKVRMKTALDLATNYFL